MDVNMEFQYTSKRMTWEEIVKAYPHSWVLLKDVIEDENTYFVKSAVVVKVSKEKVREDDEKRFFSQGYEYEYTSIGDGGVKIFGGYI